MFLSCGRAAELLVVGGVLLAGATTVALACEDRLRWNPQWVPLGTLAQPPAPRSATGGSVAYGASATAPERSSPAPRAYYGAQPRERTLVPEAVPASPRPSSTTDSTSPPSETANYFDLKGLAVRSRAWFHARCWLDCAHWTRVLHSDKVEARAASRECPR